MQSLKEALHMSFRTMYDQQVLWATFLVVYFALLWVGELVLDKASSSVISPLSIQDISICNFPVTVQVLASNTMKTDLFRRGCCLVLGATGTSLYFV